MSVPGDPEAASTSAITDGEAALFSSANELLVHLTNGLKERPHGQISLIQLPDVFLIEAQLEQLTGLEAKKVKHQETLIQMALDREEEGSKSAKKRVKAGGTQAAAIRQAVCEEVSLLSADTQRHTSSLEDRLKKAEKRLEASDNENKCLADQVRALQADVNRIAKTTVAGRLEVAEKRHGSSDKESKLLADQVKVLQSNVNSAQEDIRVLINNGAINDARHDDVVARLVSIADAVNINAAFFDRVYSYIIFCLREIQGRLRLKKTEEWTAEHDAMGGRVE